MKLLVLALCISVQVLSTYSKILPKNFPDFCSKSEPEYNQCMKDALRSMGPYFLKGIKSIDFPKLHPLTIPSFVVNRDLNNFISVKAEIKNIQVYGFNDLDLQTFEFDPNTLKGHMVAYIPTLNFKLEFDAKGIVGDLSITNAGFVSGNVSGVDLEFYFDLKKIDRVGAEYLTVDKIRAKGGVQGAHISVIAKNPADQATSDFIAEVFNDSAKEIFEIVNPIYVESIEAYYGALLEKFLSAVPADELIPE